MPPTLSEQLSGLLEQRPDLFSQEERQLIGEGAAMAPVAGLDEHGTNAVQAIGKFLQGIGSGFTTLDLGERPTNTIDEIAFGLGHLIGFAGFFPGTSAAAKVGVSALARIGLSSPGWMYRTAAYGWKGVRVPSVPMAIAGAVTKRGAEFIRATKWAQTASWMKQGATVPFLTEGAAHLGVASFIGARSVLDLDSWTTNIDERVHGFLYGAGSGAVFRGFGMAFAKGGKLDLGSPGYNAAARIFAGALAQGMPATLAGAPTATQVYDYAMGGLFGGLEKSPHQLMARELMQARSRETLGRAKMMLDPKGTPGYEKLSPLAKEEFDFLADLEFGRLREVTTVHGDHKMANDAILAATKGTFWGLQRAIQEGRIEKLVQEGHMTAEQAKTADMLYYQMLESRVTKEAEDLVSAGYAEQEAIDMARENAAKQVAKDAEMLDKQRADLERETQVRQRLESLGGEPDRFLVDDIMREYETPSAVGAPLRLLARELTQAGTKKLAPAKEGEKPQEVALDEIAVVTDLLDMVDRATTVTENVPAGEPFEWARSAKDGYEVSSHGDRRFSALHAKLSDGRTIEEAYQKAKGTGKNKKAKDPNFDYWGTYLGLWRQWASENPLLVETLRKEARGRKLTDKFAKTENNQARALATILNETAASVPTDGETPVRTRQEFSAATFKKFRELFAEKYADKKLSKDAENWLHQGWLRIEQDEPVYQVVLNRDGSIGEAGETDPNNPFKRVTKRHPASPLAQILALVGKRVAELELHDSSVWVPDEAGEPDPNGLAPMKRINKTLRIFDPESDWTIGSVAVAAYKKGLLLFSGVKDKDRVLLVEPVLTPEQAEAYLAEKLPKLQELFAKKGLGDINEYIEKDIRRMFATLTEQMDKANRQNDLKVMEANNLTLEREIPKNAKRIIFVAPEDAKKPGEVWKHEKTGHIYVEALDASGNFSKKDLPRLVRSLTEMLGKNITDRYYTTIPEEARNMTPRELVPHFMEIAKSVSNVRVALTEDPTRTDAMREAFGLAPRTVAPNLVAIARHTYANNMAIQEMLNGGKPIERIYEKAKEHLVKDAISLNKRMQVIGGENYRLDSSYFEKPTWNVLVVDDIGVEKEGVFLPQAIRDKNGVVKSIRRQKSIIPTDGGIMLRHSIMKRTNLATGQDENAGFIKPTAYSVDAELGAMLWKAGIHPVDNELNAWMEANNIDAIVYTSAGKQVGERQVYRLSRSDKGFRIAGADGKDATPTTYEVPVKDIRVNIGISEDPAKYTKKKIQRGVRLPVQVLKNVNRTHAGDAALNEIREELNNRAIGDPKAHVAFDNYMADPTSDLAHEYVKGVNLRNIGIGRLLKVLMPTVETNHPLWDKLMRQLLKLGEETTFWDSEEVDSPEGREYLRGLNEIKNSAELILKTMPLEPAVLRIPQVRTYIESIVRQHIVNTSLRPEVPYSWQSVITLYDPQMQYKFKMQTGHYRLNDGHKNTPIEIDGKEMTLEKALALRDKNKLDARGKADLEDALSHLIVRTPSEAMSGGRVLILDGFTGKRGYGAMLHPEDMEYLGGADNDADKVFVFMRVGKELKRAYKKNEKLRHMPMVGEDGSKGLVMQPSKTTKELLPSAERRDYMAQLLSNPLSAMSPVARIEVARGAYEGNAILGPALNYVNRRLVLAEMFRYERNVIDALSRLKVDIVNFSADAADYGGLATMDEIRKLIARTAHGELGSDPKTGRDRMFPDKWTRKFEKGLTAVDQAARGWNYDTDRPYTLAEFFGKLRDANEGIGAAEQHLKRTTPSIMADFARAMSPHIGKSMKLENGETVVEDAFQPLSWMGAQAVRVRSEIMKMVNGSSEKAVRVQENTGRRSLRFPQNYRESEGYKAAKPWEQVRMVSDYAARDFIDMASIVHVNEVAEYARSKGATVDDLRGVQESVTDFKDRAFKYQEKLKAAAAIDGRYRKKALHNTSLGKEIVEYYRGLPAHLQAYFRAYSFSSLYRQEKTPSEIKNDATNRIAKLQSMLDKVAAGEMSMPDARVRALKERIAMWEEVKNQAAHHSYRTDFKGLAPAFADIVDAGTIRRFGEIYVEMVGRSRKLKAEAQPKPTEVSVDKAEPERPAPEIRSWLEMLKDFGQASVKQRRSKNAEEEMARIQKTISDYIYQHPHLAEHFGDIFTWKSRTAGPSGKPDVRPRPETATLEDLRRVAKALDKINYQRSARGVKFLDWWRFNESLFDLHEAYDQIMIRATAVPVLHLNGTFDQNLTKAVSTMELVTTVGKFQNRLKSQDEQAVSLAVKQMFGDVMILGREGMDLFKMAVHRRERHTGGPKSDEYNNRATQVERDLEKPEWKNFRARLPNDEGRLVEMTAPQIVDYINERITRHNAMQWAERVAATAEELQYPKLELKSEIPLPADVDPELTILDRKQILRPIIEMMANETMPMQMRMNTLRKLVATRAIERARVPIRQLKNGKWLYVTFRDIGTDAAKWTKKHPNYWKIVALNRLKQHRPYLFPEDIVPYHDAKDQPRHDWYWPRTLHAKEEVEKFKAEQLEMLRREGGSDAEVTLLGREIDKVYDESRQPEHATQEDLMQMIMTSPTVELTQDQVEMSGTRQTPQNLMKRNERMGPMPGYDLTPEALVHSATQLVRTYHNIMGALLSHELIDQFEERKPMGKQESFAWADFMRNYVRNWVGSPSTFTEDFNFDNRMGLNWNPYKLLTDQYWIDMADKLSITHFAGKELFTFERVEEAHAEHAIAKKALAVLKKEFPTIKSPEQFWASDVTPERLGLTSLSKDTFVKHWRAAKLVESGEAKNLDRAFVKEGLIRVNQKISRYTKWLSNMEGKWSLLSLLANTKSAVYNLVYSNLNTVIDVGFNYWRKAGDFGFIRSKMRMLNGKEVEGWGPIEEMVDKHGVESFVKYQLLNNNLKADVYRDIIAEVGALKDKTPSNIVDVLRRKGALGSVVDAGAWFMRIAEVQARRRAWLAHYLKAIDTLEANNGRVFDDPEHPWLVQQANKGVEFTQYIYNNASKPAFARTALGGIFSRFMMWSWNSMRFRKHVFDEALAYKVRPGSEDFDRLKRLITADAFSMMLAGMYPASMFGANLPQPWSYLSEAAGFFWGDSDERERAFMGQLPYPYNFAQPLFPPSMRVLSPIFSTLTTGEFDKFSSYYFLTLMPFGKSMYQFKQFADSPSKVLEIFMGLPVHQAERMLDSHIPVNEVY